MKKTSKILLSVLCIVAVLTVSVAGVLAYLIDQTNVVTNTFTVGDVQIKLDETKVDPEGKPVTPEEKTEIGNEYHLIPGQTYTKDPTVTVLTGSEESYVRIKVTINKMAELKAIFGNDFLPGNYVTGWDQTKWPCVGITDNGDNTATYEFRYYTTVSTVDATDDLVLPALFTSFTLPGELVDGEDLKTLQPDAATGDPGLKIDVVGHAIQRSMLDTADEAWAAFDAQQAANATNP